MPPSTVPSASTPSTVSITESGADTADLQLDTTKTGTATTSVVPSPSSSKLQTIKKKRVSLSMAHAGIVGVISLIIALMLHYSTGKPTVEATLPKSRILALQLIEPPISLTMKWSDNESHEVNSTARVTLMYLNGSDATTNDIISGNHEVNWNNNVAVFPLVRIRTPGLYRLSFFAVIQPGNYTLTVISDVIHVHGMLATIQLQFPLLFFCLLLMRVFVCVCNEWVDWI
jgi:hypothetical protein